MFAYWLEKKLNLKVKRRNGLETKHFIKRDSREYQDLLDRAFEALATNKKFQKTLLDTQNATLTHAMGKKKTSETVLTTQEFCSRLTKIREQLKTKG